MKIRFVGDICLVGDIERQLLLNKNKAFFDALRDEETLLVGNLESPISTGENRLEGKFACFQSDPKITKFLHKFDILSLSNNHMTDFGHASAFQTKELLNEVGIQNVGYGKNLEEALDLSILERDGVKVGVGTLSCLTTNGFNVATNSSPGVATYSLQLVKEIIPKWKSKVDVLFVFFHWGLENNHSIVEDQMIIAHACVDSGANAVVGTHGHVVQPYELYKGQPIFYGLGNLVFSDFDYKYTDASGKNIEGRYVQKETNLESLSPVFEIESKGKEYQVNVASIDAYKFDGSILNKIKLHDLTVNIKHLNNQISNYFTRSKYMMSIKKDKTEIDYLSEYRYPNIVYFYNSKVVKRKGVLKLIILDVAYFFTRIKNKILFRLKM